MTPGEKTIEALLGARSDLVRVQLPDGAVWIRHDAGSPETALAEARGRVAELTTEVDSLRALLEMNEGHDEPCYYCGEPCNGLAGNPALWPIALCHSDDPGRVKWHHEGCVSKRLHDLDRLRALLQEAGEAIDSLVDHYESCEAAIFEQQFGELNPKAKALLAKIRAETGETI